MAEAPRDKAPVDKALEAGRWDLTALYEGPADSKIDSDLAEIGRLAKEFIGFQGRLSAELAPALKIYARIAELSDMTRYLYLCGATDAGNQEIKKRASYVEEALVAHTAKMSFFETELGAMDNADYEAQLSASEFLAKNRPFLDDVRNKAKYFLSPQEETMLSRLSPFGGGEWDDMLDEIETLVDFDGKTMTESIHIMNTSPDSDVRFNEMSMFNRRLSDSNYRLIRTRALNLVAGKKNTIDQQRGYTHVMQSRNIENNLDDATVDSLHKAVLTEGALQGQRYYRIMARLLGKEKLLWSDRNAPNPFENTAYIPYDACKNTVLAAFRSFSPTLEELVREAIAANTIDAPAYKGKIGGAFNYSGITRCGRPSSFTLLNYMGSPRDVMTFAHELGHCVHGLLGAEEQGVLLWHAPMAYAETASIFAEMLTFEHLLAQAATREEKLSLLLGKAGDWLNSVNRQISFSLFEQQFHEVRKGGKVSPAEFDAMWLGVTRQMYGNAFEYKDMEHLWCYIGHFMRPFYVYAYSFGELFTQSLFAAKESLGNRFEPLYLDMLKAGGSRNAVELMAPFGLDPKTPDFWTKGIEVSIKAWLDEVEALI